jgi:hypothetical protein
MMRGFKMDRSFYTSGYQKMDPDVYGGEVAGFEAYTKNMAGNPYAMVFFGKQSKPVWHTWFFGEEAMIKNIKESANNWKNHNKRKQAERDKKKAYVPKVKIGDIFRTSWGYDQTNVDFYQVINNPSPHFVEVKEIKQDLKETGFMCGQTRPLKDQFIENAPVMRKKVLNDAITIDRSRTGYLMKDAEVENGPSYYVSWYA